MKRMLARITAVAAATLGLAGCGTDQPPVCDSLEAAQATMNQIRTAHVSENGLAPLKGYLQQLGADVRKLLADAGTQFAPEVDAVRTAADQVSTTVTAARESPDAPHLSAVRTSVNVLRTELRDLGDAMSGTC